MDFHPELNLLLEALAYLGRRAAGYDTAWMLERLRSRGVSDTDAVAQRLSPIGALMERLNRSICVEDERLQYLFGNLPGFPYNTTGTYSRAFLLLHPMLPRFDGDLNRTMEQARQRSRERLAGDLADMLDLSEETCAEPSMALDELTARVLSLAVPAESKVAVLELCHGGEALLEELRDILEQVIRRLEREQKLLKDCIDPFLGEMAEQGPETILSQTSALNSRPDREDRIVPFVFGMDTLLAVTPAPGRPVQVYCGVLRLPLQTALAGAKGPEVEVYEAIKLLADQTRFEILCHLRSHDAYGQELAAKFGLSRNTIHHHMTKLLAAHLVKCTVDGNRVYYHANEESIRRLLDRQRELLLP